MKTGAVIVAAGMSSRMSDFKPMLKIGTISMIKRIISNFQQANIFPIVVVTGYRGEELEKHIAKFGVICLKNKNYKNSEMFDSAKIGFSYISGKCERFFFTPVDIPLFTVKTITRMLKTNAPITKPVCNGKDGHPILIADKVLPSLLKAETQGGLKGAIEKTLANNVNEIQVDDEGILLDADTPADYERLIKQHNKQLLRPTIDISLICENKLFDKDGAILLRLIEYTGTVKGACQKLNISYSKAWKTLSDLEKNLNFELVERKQGGERGGKSKLTQRGKQLLNQYEDFTERVQKYAAECFLECFKGITE